MSTPTAQLSRPSAADWLVGGGEMGTRIRATDWASTPLGPIETWPQSLRSAVSILLPSKAQIVLFWGPDLVSIYNDAYRPVFGAKHPVALGMPARQAFSEAWHVLEPLFQSVLDTGEAFWAQDHLFGLDRQGYLEETYFDVSYDPVRDETGRVGGLFCIVSDTTGRMVGERRLAALRDLARIGNNANSDADVFRNAGAVLARYENDLPFVALYSWDGANEVATLEAMSGIEAGSTVAPSRIDASQRGASWPVGGDADMTIAAAPNGVTLPGGPWPEPAKRAAVLKIASAGHEPIGYLVAGISARRGFDDDYADFLRLVASNIATAITSVRALEDERRRAAALAELDQAKTTFFSNVSHEFRTPLTLMLGPLEDLIARSDNKPDAEERALLGVAHRNGQRLHKLVNTLLDFARIEAGRTQASYEPTDIGTLTVDLASNFRSACERAGLALSIDCPRLPDPVFVDHEMWEKMVLNLLSNAFKFTLDGGIDVRVIDAGSSVQLIVRDTGTGIPQDELPRMFERFHRIDDTRGRSHEGSGIGLALVHELVKLHGGSIVVSNNADRGATFTVSIPKGSAHLPVDRVQSRPARATSPVSRAGAYVAEVLGWLPAVEATDSTEKASGTPRVLLADDNADLREYARKLLSEQYDVCVVPDGQAALDAARECRPDLIVSDVMMPKLDGFGLIRELRADPDLRAIPVILLSARAGEEARLEGLGKGADDYLVKPFSSRELLVRAGALIKSAEMHRRVQDALAQLREADTRKDEFLATLAHELRNPLAALRSSVEVLRSVEPGTSAAVTSVQIMDRQLNHLVRLVDDLMEVSRITRGDVELRKTSLSLGVALRNAIEATEPMIRAAGHRLVVSTPAEPMMLAADSVRLAQIFGNLLNNAAKYSERGGTITVEARREGDEAVVAISDTGDGIAPEQLPMLFNIFTRGNLSSIRNQSGLGIGLALVRSLVDMHGGRVEAESGGVGKGSRFTVRLPLLAAADISVTASPPASVRLQPIRILVVDDNHDAAESLRMLLSGAGADVHVAHDGLEAIEAFAACEPRVVLLDIGMPGMNGYDVARKLRETRSKTPVSLVALTGWGQDEDRRRVREAGFDHHLVKPANIEELELLIANVASEMS